MKRSLQKVALGLVCAAMTLEVSCIAEMDEGEVDESVTTSAIKHVFVITFENHDPGQIYGNAVDAPYINNTLIPQYARSSNFQDRLPSLPSEPHYVWMEAGTNEFTDHTFTSDFPPWFFGNSTGNTEHLVTQIKNATNGVTWRSYQEGINWLTGACPINDWGQYAAKHNPFVFFRDVAGNPPSSSNAYCASHHKELGALAADLANNAVASYNFITPNLCNDMHGNWGCPDSNKIRSGDTWLQNNLPPLIAWANTHAGVIFLVWDEGEGTPTMPFIVVGPHVKPGYTSTVAVDHSSLVKSLERILELPILPKVSSATDFSDFFQAGYFP
jgi:phosphatidylinositol-3-phosphatase